MAKSKALKKGTARRPQLDRESALTNFSGAEAALQTAILALENKGTFSTVSFSLRRHVMIPLLSLSGQISGKPSIFDREEQKACRG